MQNIEVDRDDDSEDNCKVDREDRETYLAERAEKRRSYNREYKKRPEVVAKRKLAAKRRLEEKQALGSATDQDPVALLPPASALTPPSTDNTEEVEVDQLLTVKRGRDQAAYKREYNKRPEVIAKNRQYRLDHSDKRAARVRQQRADNPAASAA